MNILMNKTAYIIAAVATAFVACADLDIEPESDIFTGEQEKDLLKKYSDLSDGELIGMYQRIGKPGAVLGVNAYNNDAYPDDGGYPTVCISFDLNGPDMTSPNLGYNWFDVSNSWADRNEQFRNPRLRWMLFYMQIKAANDIIRSIDKDAASASLLATRGQALAVRAFDYLNLAPYYQFRYNGNQDKPCVPIITEESSGSTFPRNTVAEVYNQIINDLTEAIQCLEGFTRTSKFYVDQSVAYGLRARANLYMEKWQEAADDATKALELCCGECDGMPYTIEEVSQPAFCSLEDHNWMWGIKMTSAQIGESVASWPSWLGSFSGNGYSEATQCYCMINKILFDKIPETDVRRGWWVDMNLHSDNLAKQRWGNAVGDEISTLYISEVKQPYLPFTNVKFGQLDGCGSIKNGGDWCIMRVEEMILIQAEAYAKAGNEAKGKEILSNFVTSFRNPSYTQTCSTFADEVWMQRRIELWGEGFSMSDIMRLGKPVVRFHDNQYTNVDEDFQFNVMPNNEYILLRIPKEEIDSNNAMQQNTGGTAPSAGDNGTLRDGVTD